MLKKAQKPLNFNKNGKKTDLKNERKIATRWVKNSFFFLQKLQTNNACKKAWKAKNKYVFWDLTFESFSIFYVHLSYSDYINFSFWFQRTKAIFDKQSNGVVFVSFGSIADTRKMSNHMKMTLIKTFSEFPQFEFIWKMDPNPEDQKLFESAKNLHIFQWVQQPAILSKAIWLIVKLLIGKRKWKWQKIIKWNHWKILNIKIN